MQRAEFRQNGFNSEIVFKVIFNLNFIIKLNMQFYYSEVIYRQNISIFHFLYNFYQGRFRIDRSNRSKKGVGVRLRIRMGGQSLNSVGDGKCLQLDHFPLLSLSHLSPLAEDNLFLPRRLFYSFYILLLC